ncbi:hypothetical protein QFW82_00175 [Streptomyces malaysiensis subsp. malaysiensis]|uniref:hypothetical protein n=1 Tax=Streptomyces malaysiensis TaxID=92644 RepID=UPI0024C002CB|nr:hypothetical protein [Streptomyces sp. NA07423]WHX15563.1 hypothetical protein QFW82_00175 [Streptomyces sp. NA07423]
MSAQRPLSEVSPSGAGASFTRWIQDSGASVSNALRAWEHGELAELPAGKAWDAVRLEQPAGWQAIRLPSRLKLPLGPVLYAHLAVEVPVPVRAADDWDLPGATVLGVGTTLLVPHGRIVAPITQHGRSWIVPPNHLSPLTDADDLYGVYFATLAKDGELRGVRR